MLPSQLPSCCCISMSPCVCMRLVVFRNMLRVSYSHTQYYVENTKKKVHTPTRILCWLREGKKIPKQVERLLLEYVESLHTSSSIIRAYTQSVCVSVAETSWSFWRAGSKAGARSTYVRTYTRCQCESTRKFAADRDQRKEGIRRLIDLFLFLGPRDATQRKKRSKGRGRCPWNSPIKPTPSACLSLQSPLLSLSPPSPSSSSSSSRRSRAGAGTDGQTCRPPRRRQPPPRRSMRRRRRPWRTARASTTSKRSSYARSGGAPPRYGAYPCLYPPVPPLSPALLIECSGGQIPAQIRGALCAKAPHVTERSWDARSLVAAPASRVVVDTPLS